MAIVGYTAISYTRFVRLRGDGRRAVRTEPDGRAARREPAHGAAGVAVRPRRPAAAFLLRVEDLDPADARPEHEARQLADLAALGIDWDPPVVRQSERRAAHDAAIARLVAAGRTYPCYCTRREIREAARRAARAGGRLPRARAAT